MLECRSPTLLRCRAIFQRWSPTFFFNQCYIHAKCIWSGASESPEVYSLPFGHAADKKSLFWFYFYIISSECMLHPSGLIMIGFPVCLLIDQRVGVWEAVFHWFRHFSLENLLILFSHIWQRHIVKYYGRYQPFLGIPPIRKAQILTFERTCPAHLHFWKSDIIPRKSTRVIIKVCESIMYLLLLFTQTSSLTKKARCPCQRPSRRRAQRARQRGMAARARRQGPVLRVQTF